MIYRKNKLLVDGFNIDNLGKKYKTPIYCFNNDSNLFKAEHKPKMTR